MYQLSSRQFMMKLQVNGTTGMRISPGFHPYFSVPRDTEDVEINGERFELSELLGTEFRTANEQVIEFSNRTVRLQSKGLPTWAIWTDRLDSYVCVEPTLGGNMFRDGEALIMRDGTNYSYSLSIVW
jgi:galactose mutarotase-like enzyme